MNGPRDHPPSVVVLYFHVDCSDLDPGRLEERANLALPACLAEPGGEESVLADCGEIEVSLVSDEAIARVHGEFMDDPTPTDVITFHHGEILVSVETARREGPGHGNTAEEETLLYIIHGLLHLNGYTDLREPDRSVMHRLQERILASVLKRPHPLSEVGPTNVPT
jgi:probable rRNA maturation factor